MNEWIVFGQIDQQSERRKKKRAERRVDKMQNKAYAYGVVMIVEKHRKKLGGGTSRKTGEAAVSALEIAAKDKVSRARKKRSAITEWGLPTD